MRIGQILLVGAAAMVMAGCEDYGYYGPGPGPYGYGPGPAYGPGPYADVEYDGWYDGYYGPIYDGYWQNDVFFYRTRDSDRWHRGDARHFSREERPGFNHIHGMAHARPAERRPDRE
jgi:hypothetical protein